MLSRFLLADNDLAEKRLARGGSQCNGYLHFCCLLEAARLLGEWAAKE